MNKDTFMKMRSKKRVEEVNKLLQTYSLKQVADNIGIPYSTFLKEMTTDDHVYIQRENRYYKFLRDVNEIYNDSKGMYSDELIFLQENMEAFKKLIIEFKSCSVLMLDRRIYSKKANYVNKSIKMNDEIYQEFTEFCENRFPHLKLQDLIAQSILDFITKYEND